MNGEPLSDHGRARIHETFKRVPFAQYLGLELIEVERGRAVVGADIRADYLQVLGVLHGGFTAALIDTATAFALISHLNAGETSTTVDLNIHYLRPITLGKITATSVTVRAGRRLITVTAEVKDQEGRMCAIATSTYARIAAVPAGPAST